MSSHTDDSAVLTQSLRKHYPGRGAALDGLDLAVAPGTIHGLLGPNGAGKTTAVRILATLSRPDSGHARVAGCDVNTDPAGVRARIGVAGQYAAVDEVLSGRQNLDMFARLHQMRPRAAKRRAAGLLERFQLEAAAERPVAHYSGGMRRRLDLAISLIRSPDVLFLDEPTTGLDPRSRSEVWDAVRELTLCGTTVLLTTQYLEEADRLCSSISLMNHGQIIIEGSPAELKSQVGTPRAEILVPADQNLADTAETISRCLGVALQLDPATRRILAPVRPGSHALIQLAHTLEEAGLETGDIALRRPDLDEVFLRLTDQPVSEGADQ